MQGICGGPVQHLCKQGYVKLTNFASDSMKGQSKKWSSITTCSVGNAIKKVAKIRYVQAFYFTRKKEVFDTVTVIISLLIRSRNMQTTKPRMNLISLGKFKTRNSTCSFSVRRGPDCPAALLE